LADRGEDARSASPGQARCHAVAGQLDQGVRHRIPVHERMLELAKCLDCLESACYPKRKGDTSQVCGVAFFERPVRSAPGKTWQILYSGGAGTTGAASAGLPDTSATEAALIAEVLKHCECDAEKADLLQLARITVLPAWVLRQAAVSAASLHLSLTAVDAAQFLFFDA